MSMHKHLIATIVRFCILLMVTFLAGCGVQYRSDAEDFLRSQPPEAWGEPPAKAARLLVEEQWLAARLKDPYSAKLGFSEIVERGTVSKTMLDPTVVPIWYSYVTVNAKNSYGGYTGAKTYTFMYQGKRLYAVDSPEEGRDYLATPVDVGAIENAQRLIEQHRNPGEEASVSASGTSASKPAGLPAKNEFKVGQLARSLNCETPALLSTTASTETYQASCPGGQYKLISCEFTNCRVMQ